MVNVSPCHWKVVNSRRSSPNHSRARGDVLDLHRVPADLLHRVARHLAAQRAREHLPAEAMADHRHAARDRVAHEGEHRLRPRQLVVGAHRPAHEGEAREAPRSRRAPGRLRRASPASRARRLASRNVAKCPGPSVSEKRKTATGFTMPSMRVIGPSARSPAARVRRRRRDRRERDRPLLRQGGDHRSTAARRAPSRVGADHAEGVKLVSADAQGARCSRSTASARRSRWGSTSRPPAQAGERAERDARPRLARAFRRRRRR